MKRQTPGQRVYLVRLARGDGVKRAEKLEEFSMALTKRGTRYDASTLSRIENGDRKVTLEDCEAIAPLDPLKRGASWIAFGEQKTPSVEESELDDIEVGAVALTPAQLARAEEQVARDLARRAATTAPHVRPRKRGGKSG